MITSYPHLFLVSSANALQSCEVKLFSSFFICQTYILHYCCAVKCFDRRLGWDPKQGESHLDAMLRGELLAALSAFGHDVTIEEASKRFHAFLNDRDTPLLPPDIRRVG